MSEVLRATYHEELDALEAAFQEEGSLVLRALRGAINALEQQDTELADEVIAFDDEIDTRYHDIERKIELLLARQTPVASELRLVLAILHNNIHLERMGDQCVTIAKLTKLSAQLHQEQRLVEGLEEMGSRAEEMTRLALEAFAARDVERARSLTDLDELIDRTNRRVVEQVMALSDDPSSQEWGMRMIVVSRCLERIGDNAVDIGEQTAYLVTGEFHEFTDASHRPPGEI
jgi:phosphate transport system protein